MLAIGAYDEAKAAAGYAEKVHASHRLIETSRQMQADALLIEKHAEIRIADAVDEAQASGKLARVGRPKMSEGADNFSLEDIGLDRRRLVELRKLRNAERAGPGFIDRIIKAQLAQGLEPSRASLKKAAAHAIGTKTATKEARGEDLYETPIEAIRTLLALESFGLNVLEPSVGKGAILRPLEDAGYRVAISDVVARGIETRDGTRQAVGDFLLSVGLSKLWSVGPDIVTNPPYGVANAFIAHALREHRPNKMAMLLNSNFMFGFEDDDRRFVMDEHPPSRIYVLTRRLPMMHRDGWDGPKASSQMNCAWFVWERNHDGSYGEGYPRIIRVDWKAYESADPLLPGAGGHVPPIGFRPADEFARETPRRTPRERAEATRQQALAWMAGQVVFDAVSLRRGFGTSSSVATALIEALLDEGLLGATEGGYRLRQAVTS
ncbi:hypothetical protein [Rhizobium halophytocola]|nr:hypothetical protein [Rhizobium halophytocola]